MFHVFILFTNIFVWWLYLLPHFSFNQKNKILRQKQTFFVRFYSHIFHFVFIWRLVIFGALLKVPASDNNYLMPN